MPLANCTSWHFSELTNLEYLGLPGSSMTCDGMVVPASAKCEDGGTSAMCHESCFNAGDNYCNDDFGEAVCPLGTDCADCGPRVCVTDPRVEKVNRSIFAAKMSRV